MYETRQGRRGSTPKARQGFGRATGDPYHFGVVVVAPEPVGGARPENPDDNSTDSIFVWYVDYQVASCAHSAGSKAWRTTRARLPLPSANA